jgi:hypothetical protein
MKAVTEFSVFTLNKAIQAKAALAAEGKTPEEIQENLGQNFKLEGEKLGYFIQSLDIASTNEQNLKRVLIVRLNEGEKAPAKAVQVGELHFVPEFYLPVKPAPVAAANAKGGGKGGKGGNKGGGGPKGSPWGLSPEEKALKNKKQAAK